MSTNTLPLTTDCRKCDGSGREEYTHQVKVDENVNPIIPDHLKPEDINRTEDHEVRDCRSCSGFGVVKGSSGYGMEYKSQAAATKARERGTGTKCASCDGRAKVIWLPGFKDCYSCSGRGKVPTWDPEHPVLGEEVGHCENATPEFMEAWLKSITISVVRTQRGLTWGESHLGMIGMGTCTDYGTCWDRDPEDDWMLAMEIAQDWLDATYSGEQYIKMIDEDRKFGPALLVILTNNGYTKLVADTPVSTIARALPPTYFPKVLEEI